MQPQTQHEYFDTAYRTGSDIWTHIAYHKKAIEMMPAIPPHSIVLDIGSGRGLWAFMLIDHGFRVIGIDYVQSIVDRVNADIKLHHYAQQARFIHGHATDLPFTDNSFPLVTDIGLLQHLSTADWHQYFSELARVTQPGGYVLSINLSDQTPRFLGFTPKFQNNSPYEKFGVSYYFFSKEKLEQLFASYGFTLIKHQEHFFETRSDPADTLGLHFMLLQKK
jgi:ubiquinone/menaquinone biosynthesis C-methylase UbiE